MTEDELMLTSILGCNRTDLILKKKDLSGDQKATYRNMKLRKSSGEPLQYIIGDCDFMDSTLDIDSRVLIPRPETEIMVELAINKIKSEGLGRMIRVLDLGTGSGNIPISFAKELKTCHVTTVDVSSDALQVAEGNAKKNFVFDKIDFVNQDMIKFLSSECVEKFDVIISNPPYISTSDLDSLPLNVQQEPMIALDGGDDGLNYYKKIVPLSLKHLSQDGFLICEIGDGQADGIVEIFDKCSGYSNVSFAKDYVGTDRIVIAEKRK